MEGVAGRVDFIDRQVKMHIVGVMVQDADALMLAKSESLTDSGLNRSHGRSGGHFSRPETDDEMIGLIGLRPCVERLGIQHFE